MKTIKSVLGLFFPIGYKEDTGELVFTLSVGKMPLGWIMVIVAWIVKIL